MLTSHGQCAVRPTRGRLVLAKSGMERVEGPRCQGDIRECSPTAVNLSRISLISWDNFGEWCNGSTTDSDSVCLGSNPSSPAKPDAQTESRSAAVAAAFSQLPQLAQ